MADPFPLGSPWIANEKMNLSDLLTRTQVQRLPELARRRLNFPV